MASNQVSDAAAKAEPVALPEAEATANACLLAWKVEAAFEERGPDPRSRLIVLCGAEVSAWRAAAQLGAAYAALGWNTVVVDGHCVAEPAAGAIAAREDSVVPASKPRLSVVRGQTAPTLAEARSTREFLKRLASHFERVVVATGLPQATAAVAPALAMEADAVVIVIRPRHTRRQTVTTAVDALRDLGAPVVGIVLSDE
jgi:Mrp family chromosome partitioning ATPase